MVFAWISAPCSSSSFTASVFRSRQPSTAVYSHRYLLPKSSSSPVRFHFLFMAAQCAVYCHRYLLPRYQHPVEAVGLRLQFLHFWQPNTAVYCHRYLLPRYQRRS